MVDNIPPAGLSLPGKVLKGRYGKKILMTLRLLVLGFILGYIGFTLHRRHTSLESLYAGLTAAWTWHNRLPALLLLLLMPVNWLLEARKWQLLAAKVERITLREALKGVFAGLSLGFVTPNTLGDYAARIWLLGNRNRLEAIGAVMLGRVAQLYVTLLAGNLALVHFLATHEPAQRGAWLASVLAGVTLLAAGSYVAFNRRFITRLRDFRFTRPLAPYFLVLQAYRPGEVLTVLGLATLRYLVFTLQFLLLLYIFGIHLPLPDLLTGTGLVYLAKSIVPAFHFLSDLGVREFSAIYVFGHYGIEAAPALSATLSLWLLNILLPALLGSGWVFHRRFGQSLLPR